MRTRIRPTELTAIAATLLLALGPIVNAAHAAGAASLSQYDPDWPLDGRTAFLLIAPPDNPLVFDSLQWTGQFYMGDGSGPIEKFYLRLYEDLHGVPGEELVFEELTDWEAQASPSDFWQYSADCTPVHVPSSTAVWLELQAVCPAVPQWGLVAVENPPVMGQRLLFCPTLGIYRWQTIPLLEENPRDPVPLGTRSPIPNECEASAARSIAIRPNPSHTEHRILLSLPAQSWITATVHDISGRTVRTLFSGDLEAGRHILTWNGHDNADRRCGPGIYYLRVADQANQPLIRKLVVIQGHH